ncbi:helix-turn-helix domain-containing protein [Paenibacillus sp. HW567]|uniref:helix-turn-helix domain-containing protein n=1 Tax=Paenibacillus sp. HW567 TaxID=1034769 RepID=UPI000380B1CA|nr:helix-turn-helix domain-containing protein [Paenibacillus sp. HW567]
MNAHQKYMDYYTQDGKLKNGISQYRLNKEYAEGTIIRCELEQGVEMVFFDYEMKERQCFGGFEQGGLIEIFYCLSGDISMEYEGTKAWLKMNMIGIYDFNSCPQKVIFEKGTVKGISLLLNTDSAESAVRKHFVDNHLDISQMRERISERQPLFLAFDHQNLRSVFLDIADNPFGYERDYLLLKALELVLVSIQSLKKGPQQRSDSKKSMRQRNLFEKAVSYMELHMSAPLTIQDIANAIGCSERQLNECLHEYTSMTAYAYLKTLRLQRAKDLLEQTEMPVIDIAGLAGWQNPSKFSAAFKQRYGLAPKEHRKAKYLC